LPLGIYRTYRIILGAVTSIERSLAFTETGEGLFIPGGGWNRRATPASMTRP
jgi:hypothetical protein